MVAIRVVIWPVAMNRLAVEADRRAAVTDKRVAEADRRAVATDKRVVEADR